MYLLDTNVVSELRRPRPHGAVLAWLQAASHADVFVSAVTLGEMQSGVEMLRARDAAKAAEIEAWIDRAAVTYNVLPMDGRIFRQAARLLHRQSSHLNQEAMIAATAQIHHLMIVTRNVRDFDTLGVPTLNPFDRA